MNEIPIVIENVNLEIITKILDSVARKYECRVEYRADEKGFTFHGDNDFCTHIIEETLSIFSKN
jgi:hypothetical protein